MYRRLSRRLAFDGYRTAVIGRGNEPGGPGDQETVPRGIDDLITQTDPVLPVVLIGSDAGAAAVVRAAGRASVSGAVVSGVVLAGVLTERAGDAPSSWEDELDLRSACPVHRGVLAGAGAIEPGQLNAGSGVLDAADLASLTVPALAVHGDADRVAPAIEAAAVLAAAPDAEVVFVVDGRHDILNDVSHRSVAAAIVQFLERLRLPGAAPILRRDDGAGIPLVEQVG